MNRYLKARHIPAEAADIQRTRQQLEQKVLDETDVDMDSLGNALLIQIEIILIQLYSKIAYRPRRKETCQSPIRTESGQINASTIVQLASR